MKLTPAPQGGLIVITVIIAFAAGVLLSHGETTPAVAMLIALAAAWVLAAVRSA
jgi:hypothetical protein